MDVGRGEGSAGSAICNEGLRWPFAASGRIVPPVRFCFDRDSHVCEIRSLVEEDNPLRDELGVDNVRDTCGRPRADIFRLGVEAPNSENSSRWASLGRNRVKRSDGIFTPVPDEYVLSEATLLCLLSDSPDSPTGGTARYGIECGDEVSSWIFAGDNLIGSFSLS